MTDTPIGLKIPTRFYINLTYRPYTIATLLSAQYYYVFLFLRVEDKLLVVLPTWYLFMEKIVD